MGIWISVLAIAGMDLAAFAAGAIIASSVKGKFLAETAIKLQRDIINLQETNLTLINDLSTMRMEIAQLREELHSQQAAARHLRANLAMAMAAEAALAGKAAGF